MDNPFFSVIVTTYNRAELVNRALKSLFAQTETDWELILIDDGSSDGTQAKISEFFKNPKTQYIYQDNTGFIQAKNNGIALAKGKYICFLDSDDTFKPDHLQIRKQLLVENLEIDMLRGGVEIIGQPYVPDVNNPDKKIHLSECAISGTFFVSRKMMEKLDGFKGNPLNTDFDFLQRAENMKFNIQKIDFPTYVYHRDEGSSITNDMLGEMWFLEFLVGSSLFVEFCTLSFPK